jgi:L-rhamnose mutarotase
MRIAFVMSVHEGKEEAYAREHQPIWPELAAVLRRHGVRNYSIFLLPDTRQLFAYVEIEDEAQWSAIATTAECRRWWAHMARLMPHYSDGSPISAAAIEVFHLD